MAKLLNLIVEPPARVGSRKSSVDPALLDAMSEQFSADRYIGDGKKYGNSNDAENARAQYRRALAAKLSIPEHTIKSRVWGVDADGNLLSDKDAAGVWRLALTHDPNATKRTRNRNGGSAS